MDWLNLWVGTFLKKIRPKYTFEDGVKSVLYSSVIVGFLNFLSGVLENMSNAVSAFATNVILLPIAALVCLLIFTALFRWIAKMEGGKGSFKKDCAALGFYAGSLIFVGGIIVFIIGIITTASFSGASEADINYFIMLSLSGVMLAALVYLIAVVFSAWLEELALLEKLSLFSTAKVFGLASAAIILVALAIFGALVELSLGPYKTMLQYSAQYGTTG